MDSLLEFVLVAAIIIELMYIILIPVNISIMASELKNIRKSLEKIANKGDLNG